MDTIRFTDEDIPYVTTDMMLEVDRAMTEDRDIGLIQMMENAGRNLAHVARSEFFRGDPRGQRVTVLAGPGGNGGGALVCARRLRNWGAVVEVVLGAEEHRFTQVPAHQLEIVSRMGIPVTFGSRGEIPGPDLIIDGLIGYSLSGAPRGVAADLIRWANNIGAPILSLDVPSGVDSTTGSALDPAAAATATMTLALPKKGLKAARANVGALYLADIGVPPELFGRPPLNLNVGAIFAREDVVRLW